MRKIKKGFTLAEVATAMGIIGVVAAVVMPSVIKNMQKEQAGPILGRAVEQIQVGNQNMLQLGSVRSSDGSYIDTLSMLTEKDLGVSNSSLSVLDVKFKKIAVPYWGLNNEEIASSDIKTIKNYADNNTATGVNTAITGTKCYNFAKIPASVAIYSGKVESNSNELGAKTGYTIFIDTNGLEVMPNKIGRDIFAFDMLNSGALVPSSFSGMGSYTEKVVKANFRVKY